MWGIHKPADDATIKSNLTLIVVVGLILGLGFFAWDLMFSAPEHEQGVIIEKIFVAARSVSEATPYGGARRSNYFITTEKEEQWIAIVRMYSGDTVKVHCLASHYKLKNVGDILHFKKYEGKHFHIQYFAHNEEED
jgi:hypothetical protein